jgi:hypothetical protein
MQKPTDLCSQYEILIAALGIKSAVPAFSWQVRAHPGLSLLMRSAVRLHSLAHVLAGKNRKNGKPRYPRRELCQRYVSSSFSEGEPNFNCLAEAQTPADTAIAEGATNVGARTLGWDGIDP